jgi:hypothetical protein
MHLIGDLGTREDPIVRALTGKPAGIKSNLNFLSKLKCLCSKNPCSGRVGGKIYGGRYSRDLHNSKGKGLCRITTF